MQFGMLFLLAIGLAMDAFAVSVSNCLCFTNIGKKQAVITSAMFGFFQGLMPAIGFFAGISFASAIAVVDHWIAFCLLGLIGGKMIIDAVREWNEPVACTHALTMRTLLVQAVATSIDALAVGIGFAALSVQIFTASSLIAVTTFACCLIGHVIGRKAGTFLGNWAQLAGGCVLICIGSKILIEHLFFG